MKVFISWSGMLGKSLAEALRQWLPAVIQFVKPYYTPDDIAKGTRWSAEIARELEESQIGIICVTRDSLTAPWILFEAGALSKNIDKSRVCPILFDLRPSDVQGPLVQFQLSQFEEKEIRRLVKMMNEILLSTKPEVALDSTVLDSVFDMWWPKLQEKVDSILQQSGPKTRSAVRPDRELLEEILKLARVAAAGAPAESGDLTLDTVTDLSQKFHSLVETSRILGVVEPLRSELMNLWEPLHEIVMRAKNTRVRHGVSHDLLHETLELMEGKPERRRRRRKASTVNKVEKAVEDSPHEVPELPTPEQVDF